MSSFSLRLRILLPLLGILISGLIASGLTSYLTARRNITDGVSEQLDQLCRSSIVAMEDWLLGQQLAAETWATETVVIVAAEEADRQGAAHAAASRFFESLKQRYVQLEAVHFAEADASVHSSSVPVQIGKLNVADRAYFRQAMQGATAFSDAMVSKVSQKPIVVIAVPVGSPNAPRGVLISVISLNSLTDKFIDPVRVMETGYLYAYDRRGLLLAHPNQENILTFDLNKHDFGREILSKESGLIRYVFEGKPRFVAFRTSPTLGWGVAANASESEMFASVRRMRSMVLILGAATLGVSVVVMLMVVRSVSRPIETVMAGLNGGAREMASSANVISSGSQRLAEASSEQAASLEEATASLEEMAAMTRRNAESATSAHDLTQEARKAADAGASDMAEMNAAMREIKSSSDEVSKIIRTIDEIAFQTNILALNAAVEAARAGESGAGFAVVAEEVRALAQRSASAAKETSEKIEGAISKTSQGVLISERVAQNLGEIVERIHKVDGLVAEVAAASRDQNQGIQQLTTATAQMNAVTQSVAASAEESASAAEELNSQADAIKDHVHGLASLVQGARAALELAQTLPATLGSAARPDPSSSIETEMDFPSPSTSRVNQPRRLASTTRG